MMPSTRYKKLLLAFVASFLFAQVVRGQYDDSAFARYTFKDGLTADYITCLQQDDRGYLWIGTDDGLNRFDGNSFSNYRQGARDLPLASGRITNLKKLGANRIGIVTRGGIQVLFTDKFSLKDLLIPDSTSFNTHLNDGRDVSLLPDSSISLTTATGFYVFSVAGKLIFRHDAIYAANAGNRDFRYGRNIFPMDRRHCLVYVNEYGLALYDPEKRTYRETDRSDTAWQLFKAPVTRGNRYWINKFQLNTHEFIFTLYDKDSIVYYDRLRKKYTSSPLPFQTRTELNWDCRLLKINDSLFALSSGTTGFYLLTLDRANGRITCLSRKFLPAWNINCLFLDKDQRLWVGTNKGLLVQKLSSAFMHVYTFGLYDDASFTGFSCAYRYQDKLYIGSIARSGGLFIMDTAGMKITRQIRFFGDDQRCNEVRSIEMIHPDTLWLGTSGGLLWFDTRSCRYGKVPGEPGAGLNSSIVLAPPRADGYAWLCHYLDGMVVRYDIQRHKFDSFTSRTHPALPFEKVKNIAYDSYGDVWTSGHALARWNNKKNCFDTLISVYGGMNKFNDDILTLSADEHGSLWLHNAENALLEYNIVEKRFIPYTVEGGLPSASFITFSPVVNDQLWMGSANSLTRFDVVTKKIVVYEYPDGFSGESHFSRKIYYDKGAEKFYIARRDQLGIFPFSQYTNTGSYDLMIEKMVVNNEKTIFFPDSGIRLPHDENNLSLFFSIINLEPENNFGLAYRINGQSGWNSLGRQRNVHLSNLSSGNYTLQLKATGRSGQETLKTFTFTLSPPFWKTSWFLVLSTLLSAGILYYLFRRSIMRIQQKADIDKLLAQTEMKALHAQMNPHFIFNSLNSIREMILHYENKEASQYLAKFAQLIRMTLDQSSQPFISLRSTLDYLCCYVEMEMTRNTHFSFKTTVDETLDPDEIMLPPMLIQPFIENAIWHGRADGRNEINIGLSFKRQDTHLVCLVDDNGIGISRSKKDKASGSQEGIYAHSPVGISNIQRRIRLLNEKYKLDSRLTIEDKSELPGSTENGTLVTFYLPIQTEAE